MFESNRAFRNLILDIIAEIFVNDCTTGTAAARAAATLMQNIPYDVWKHILSFLPPGQGKGLYSVNSALFDIALDERYREATFCSLFNPLTKRCLTCLKYDHIASRVRIFTINPGQLCCMLQQSDSEKRRRKYNSALLTFQYKIRWKTPSNERIILNPIETESAVRRLAKILGTLTSLTTLRVEVSSKEHSHQVNFLRSDPRFFKFGWPAFGARLQTLILSIPLEGLHLALPPSDVDLPSLVNLSLHFIQTYTNTNADSILQPVVLPFFKKQSSGLHSLSLTTQHNMNIYQILKDAPLMPRLSALEFSPIFTNLQKTDMGSLQHFLEAHKSQLCSLTLAFFPHYATFPPVAEWCATPCFRVPLPHLENLCIDLNYFPKRYSAGMAPFVHQYHTSLKSLIIKTHRLTDVQVPALLAGLAASGRLQNLELSIDTLSPTLFKLLSTTLPALQSLNLDQYSLSEHGYISVHGERVFAFCAGMNELDLSHWGLRSLTTRSPLHLINSVRQSCKEALVAALPNVETFCGRTREEYLTNFEFA